MIAETSHAQALQGSTEPMVRLEGVKKAFGDNLVLDGIDLSVDPGEVLVVIGPSGSGKSTLAALILGLAAPTEGEVLLGGAAREDVDFAAWRRDVAWVPQRATIFTGTVTDNIRLGDPAAGQERVRVAAEHAGADGFIEHLPDGYDTIVGDGGRPLSAGQCQRIALARAFLRDVKLVVLDEPTANLDPESAEGVAGAMRRLSDGRAVLLIAHRPELVAHADRTVRLEEGRVVDGREAVPST